MTVPRLLTIMGSGETAPTMAKVHRALLERVGGPAVLLDTPYGFQENADDISEKAQGYFRESVGHTIEIATLRSSDADALVQDTAIRRLQSAHYVFAGPGSPTYALRQWADTPVPAVLAAKLRDGGAVTFASAAALTLGLRTLPVYEIYKAGEPPRWLDGLDLIGAATGLKVAVIPHYDNAEGGHHDTRYCYLGERRLSRLEQDLPEGAFVLGVDEHTAVEVDLERRLVTVRGLGGLTVRREGRSAVWPAGAEVGLDELASTEGGPSGVARAPEPGAAATAPTATPFMVEAARLEAVFDAALAGRDISAAVNALLELDRTLEAWAADTTQSDEPDRVRATLRTMIVRLGELAALGARDPAEAAEPFVDAVLAARAAARASQNWRLADELRDRLAAGGVEVQDTPDGQTWHLTRP